MGFDLTATRSSWSNRIICIEILHKIVMIHSEGKCRTFKYLIQVFTNFFSFYY